ncbi:DUF6326 family protein [Hyphomonas sp.]|jgi:hypothetical protein|uniref:DUF6326 family protein n=1 Tax=Hyphomonas sp. TaxID=87 RepID=UPI0025C5D4DF|nr:DUF6326 family protein [Hyphomonas sp.]
MSEKRRRSLQSFQLPRPLRLALLWVTMMFLYIYNDYFSLYLPGDIEEMMAGKIGPLGDATEAVLLGVAILMAIPALMVFASAGLPAVYSKWLNVVFGAAYTCVNIATFFGSPLFYQFTVCLETALSIFIVVSALTWPKDGPEDAR